jgi:hypothetical protein
MPGELAHAKCQCRHEGATTLQLLFAWAEQQTTFPWSFGRFSAALPR